MLYEWQHYQNWYGYHARSNWGTGEAVSEYGEGDVVEIAVGSPALTAGRVDDGPGRYRIVTVFSIAEGPCWYYRVAPIRDGRTQWDVCSDRLHVIPGECDYTEGWTLVRRAVSRAAR